MRGEPRRFGDVSATFGAGGRVSATSRRRSGPAAQATARMGLTPTPKDRLQLFYEKHNPEKVDEVDHLIDKYLRGADLPLMNRGDAAAATWIVRGDGSRRRRGSKPDRMRRSDARGRRSLGSTGPVLDSAAVAT